MSYPNGYPARVVYRVETLEPARTGKPPRTFAEVFAEQFAKLEAEMAEKSYWVTFDGEEAKVTLVRPTETDVERLSWVLTATGGFMTDYPKDDNGVSYPDNRPTPAPDGGKPDEPPAEPNPDGGDEGDRKDDD